MSDVLALESVFFTKPLTYNALFSTSQNFVLTTGITKTPT